MNSNPVAVTTTPAPSPTPAAELRAFTPAADLASAQQFTRKLAQSHYENFTVVSILLPAHLRQDFCNIYAFCRLADDLGDEMPDPQSASLALARFKEATHTCHDGQPRGALFLALADTIRRHDIPIDPFLNLIDAFDQDQRISRYPTRAALLDYCARSANPVGRLVLYVCGCRDDHRQRLSDLTCTALQLANFWQDVRRDLLTLDRIYVPQDVMKQFGVSEDQLRAGRADERYRAMMRKLVDETETMFDQGAALLPLLDPAVRGQIALFGKGGRAILHAIRASDFDTLSARPTLSAWQKSRLVASGLAARLRQVLSTPSAAS